MRTALSTSGRRLAVAASAFGLFLLVVDVALRFLDPIGLWYFAEAERYFAAMQPNAEYAYRHTPGFRGRFQGVEVVINSHGFRGPEVDFANPHARTRVLVLGDSVVFGWGTAQDAIFTSRLQHMLEHRNPRVEVIPAGVGSWNTRTEYEYLRSAGVRFAPDVIVLVVVSNDLEPHRSGRTDIPKSLLFADDAGSTRTRLGSGAWAAFVRRSYLMMYAQYIRRRRDTARTSARVNADSPRWEDARRALDGMIQLSRDAGATLLIVLYNSTGTIEIDPALRLYRGHIEAQDLVCITLPREILMDRRLQNSRVDSHPNAEGHAIIAREIYKHLMPVLATLRSPRTGESDR
jgi:lysophospholipase L1-like esterase